MEWLIISLGVLAYAAIFIIFVGFKYQPKRKPVPPSVKAEKPKAKILRFWIQPKFSGYNESGPDYDDYMKA